MYKCFTNNHVFIDNIWLYFTFYFLSLIFSVQINPIYQFSLEAFNVVFRTAIAKAAMSEDVAVRVKNLTESITYQVFIYTTRGLFERDKIIFTAQMTFQVRVINQSINRLVNSSIHQWVYKSINQSINQSINETTNMVTNQWINISINESVSYVFCRSVVRFL